jgi:hypothetical protein
MRTALSELQLLPLPLLNVGFTCLTLLTVYVFYRVSGRRSVVLLGLLLWMGLNGLLAASGFFLDSYAVPPRLGLVMVPMIVLGVYWAVGYQWCGIVVLLSVIGLAVLSAPIGYQYFGFGQPTVTFCQTSEVCKNGRHFS